VMRGGCDKCTDHLSSARYRMISVALSSVEWRFHV